MFKRRGLLKSKASLMLPGNLWQYPFDFSNAAWGMTSVTLTPGFIAPDGSANAVKIVESGTSAAQDLYGNGVLTNGANYDVQFYIKSAGNSRYVMLSGAGLTGATECPNFNPDTGGIDYGATSNRVLIGSGASMALIGNGWWRCRARVNAGNTTDFIFSLHSSPTQNAGAAYQGDGASGVLLWGPSYRHA
jgi:hypothetical protein